MNLGTKMMSMLTASQNCNYYAMLIFKSKVMIQMHQCTSNMSFVTVNTV